MAGKVGYVVEWYPEDMFDSIHVGSDADTKSKVTFTIDVKNLPMKSGLFGKQSLDGKFSVKALTEKSFRLIVEKDGQKIVVCTISNLPGAIKSSFPSPQFKYDMIKITVEKKDTGPWKEKLGTPDIKHPGLQE